MSKQDIKALMDLVPLEQSPEARRDIMRILLKGIRDVELQLSSKERVDINGARLTPQAYRSWRTKAIKAMNYMNDRYREYKALEKEASAKARIEYIAPVFTGEQFARAIAGDRQGDELQIPAPPGSGLTGTPV